MISVLGRVFGTGSHHPDGAGAAPPPLAASAPAARPRVPDPVSLDSGLRPFGQPDAVLASAAYGAPATTILFDPTKPHGLEAALRVYGPEMGVAVIDWDTRGDRPWARLIVLAPPDDKGKPE